MTVLRRLYPFFLLLCAIGCSKSTADWTAEAKAAEPAKRLHAIHALRERVQERETVVPVLMEALKDEDTSVRRDAAKALGHFGAEAREAVPSLQARLRDKEPSVRKAAALALREIDPNAAPLGKVR